MDSKDLKWFQEICRCKSITKAATRLYISPQGLSKGIKNLEMELGVSLFIRTPNGVELTRYGEYLYQKSAPLLKEWNQIALDLDRMKWMDHGYLKLCSAYGILRILSPDFIMDFEKEHPNIGIDYIEYPDCYVDDEMKQGNFDVAFHVEGKPLEGFCSIPLFTSGISLLVYEGHPLAKKSSIKVEELKGEPMVLESKAFQIYWMFVSLCQQKGFQPNIIFHTSGFSLCHKLCLQKRGLSLVVDWISHDMDNIHLRRIPLESPLEWKVSMIYRQEFAQNDLLQTFQAYTLHYLKNHIS